MRRMPIGLPVQTDEAAVKAAQDAVAVAPQGDWWSSWPPSAAVRNIEKLLATINTELATPPAGRDVTVNSLAPGRVDVLPLVELGWNENEAAESVIEHLGKLGWNDAGSERFRVYTRGRRLVQVLEPEGPQGTRSIALISRAILRVRISQACRLIDTTKELQGRVRAPDRLVTAILERMSYDEKINLLVEILETPTIRPDGSILQEEGYDEATGMLLVPTEEFPKVPEEPTREDVSAAVDELLEVVSDFPFAEEADRSAWLAMLLSMIGRPAVAGCVPLFAITANIRGAGKSLLADTASLIAYGRPASRMVYTRSNSETRKVITSVAIDATPSVLFDNVDEQLGGAALDGALTAGTISDRLLGKSEMTGDLPMRTVWIATGNNLTYGTDIERRVLPIRLNTNEESPEYRQGFRHQDLLGWVRDNRPRLAIAALTLLRAYHVAGRPSQPGGTWGSFETWVSMIRGTVVWAEQPDPLVNRAHAASNDETRDLLKLLIAGIEEADPHNRGITTHEMEPLIKRESPGQPKAPILADAVTEICGERFNARKVGNKLASFVGRTVDGKQILKEEGSAHRKKWRVATIQRERTTTDRGQQSEFGELSELLLDIPEKPFSTDRTGNESGATTEQVSSDARIEDGAEANPPAPLAPIDAFSDRTKADRAAPKKIRITKQPCRRCGEKLVRRPESPEVDGRVVLHCRSCNVGRPFRVVRKRNETSAPSS